MIIAIMQCNNFSVLLPCNNFYLLLQVEYIRSIFSLTLSIYRWEQSFHYRTLCQKNLLEEVKEDISKAEYDKRSEERPLDMELRVRHELNCPDDWDADTFG